MRAWPAFVLAAFGLQLVTAGGAQAGACDDPVLSGCVDSDTLWPHPGPTRFVGVGGTETLARGRIGFGLLASYQSRPIVLHLPSPAPFGTDHAAVDDQLNATFLFAYGVTNRLQLGATMPVTLGQGGSGLQAISGGQDLRDTATRDIRFGAALALVPRRRVEASLARDADREDQVTPFALTARFQVSAPTGDGGQFAGDRGAVTMPALAADYRRGRFFAGLELGARLRGTTEFVGARIGSQVVVGAGLGVDMLERERLSAMIEARALPTLSEQHVVNQTSRGLRSEPKGEHIVPAEWMFSLRSAPLLGGDVRFTAGGGGPIPFDGAAPLTTPRFRLVVGFGFEPRALDSDGDGLTDAEDRCPGVAGPKDAPAPGCPVERR